ncbi:Grx4 family monothiol glutaredoxin [Bdellovibrionales bacterium]|nr:Grx4 family monothiol glutaredoxin [Bdellovibrionales bacterium]
MTEPTKNKIENLLLENPIVLFMKGDAQFPQCGFSARAVSILNEVGAEFLTVNILEDQEIREGIKEFGNWPTIPQLYIKKELIGGSDIMLDMYNSGELKELIPKE